MTNPETPLCGARTVFWPDDEALDVECALPVGHEPADVHADEDGMEWSEDDMPTHRPGDDQ